VPTIRNLQKFPNFKVLPGSLLFQRAHVDASIMPARLDETLQILQQSHLGGGERFIRPPPKKSHTSVWSRYIWGICSTTGGAHPDLIWHHSRAHCCDSDRQRLPMNLSLVLSTGFAWGGKRGRSDVEFFEEQLR